MLGVIIVAAAVVIFALQQRDRKPNAGQLEDHLTQASIVETTDSADTAETSVETAAAEIGTDSTDESASTELEPAKAYLKVEMIGLGLIFEPIPLNESRDIDLPQPDGKLNVVHITEDSIEMIESNCPGQDCVHQGIVTLENRDSRPLMNMILCLPNQVILELLTPEEAAAEMAGY